MDLANELLHVADALNAIGLPYAVCGGMAMAIHGRPRLTVDLDVIVAVDDVPAARAAVAAIGFGDVSGWLPLPPGALGIDRVFRVNKLAGESFLTLDFLVADHRENAVLLDRETFEISGRRVAVLTRMALLRMKSDSTRTKDKLDVESLEEESPDDGA